MLNSHVLELGQPASVRCLLFAIFTLLLVACSQPTDSTPEDSIAEHPGTFKTVEKKYPNGPLDGYNMYFPPAYETQVDSTFPLIVFLQGGFGIGGPVGDIFRWELPRELQEQTDMETELGQLKLNTFIYVMPHIAQGEYYHAEQGLRQLLDELIDTYRVDARRIYLTGLSRGGHGTWGLASKMPERFAAVAPIAGALQGVRDYEALTTLPIWVAHNRADAKVDYHRSANGVRKLELNGALTFHTTATIAEADYQNHDHIFTSGTNETFAHDAWTEVYNEPRFYKWLLRFQLPAAADNLVD